MDQGVVDSPVILVIKAPNQKYDDQTINCYQNWTVEKLKAHLSDVYPSKPSSKDQRLVYSGKLLLDHLTLKDVLRKQDEYHMLHLVCASRTPPSSPKPPRSRGNKPQESAAGPTASQSSNSAGQVAAGEGSDWLRQQAGAFPYHHMYSQFMHSWTHQMASAPINTPSYYAPMTLMWWQQLYARQYYMHYQLLASSSQLLRPDQPSAQSSQSDPLSQRPQAGRHGNPEVQMNAQGGEILNEEELNRDWLDWVYTFSRAAILLSIVYFYSSFSRFVMVMMAMLVLYLPEKYLNQIADCVGTLSPPGRLVSLQPGKRAAAPWRPAQSGRNGGRTAKPGPTRSGRSERRRLRRRRGERRGRSGGSSQRPQRRLLVLHVVLHRHVLHVADPRRAAERC
ncbi:homocysteine-responsive endoplasmic reticulum-resident ubiquitin-like domain member 2 protein isoform X1 [Poecilia reticulata]|uniref:Homocysteine-responsive endoplasmic reticulum-resident ubiquitin-like domain member 2 protein n=1 Tax=Poecilia reticulata TaxID=8081 RepID=A0A3P9Q0N9_POERE|nr:PREDICTED: homocysteine-responsive endoplasmic reticulum-resident ubiquitin-like domain member 2 protein isoform X1 [Poecilia reticulata]XP_008420674.1 PREDICTED: homocysteine-responsive endoplasmic reticulum-resident ubiquitin-like domain member 2 protein isoform X1 [Poecilia reticulata]XP_008420675.1 PREDICTED: homocysteine-responsive endoplasmic reticulum-resident ubiquitin-like domain member 2 protein isoform X1 [Poecilia reticulata]XP_008420676.1 PREDICTED: homocysteine-responsive endopl